MTVSKFKQYGAVAIISGIVSPLFLLWFAWANATLANAIQRIGVVEIRANYSDEKHKEILGRFDKLEDKIDKLRPKK